MNHVPAEQLVAALRHLGWVVLPPGPCLERGELRLRGRVACWRGNEVVLSAMQARVLAVLCVAWPEPVTTENLYLAAEPRSRGGFHYRSTIRDHVGKLRRLLPGLIRTAERGSGYALDLEIGS